jgi:hypothetical protein
MTRTPRWLTQPAPFIIDLDGPRLHVVVTRSTLPHCQAWYFQYGQLGLRRAESSLYSETAISGVVSDRYPTHTVRQLLRLLGSRL